MKYSFENPEHCNITRWGNGTGSKFFETYYVKWNDIEKRTCCWIRYTIFQMPDERAECAVWGIFLDEQFPEKSVAIKKVYSLENAQASKDKFDLKIADSNINQKNFSGSVEENGKSLSWDIQFPKEPLLVKHFAPSLYESPLLKTKFLAPFCWGEIHGKITVNGEEISIKNTMAHEGHFWGTQQIASWAWANCGHFNEDDTFRFEGVSVRTKMAGMPMPLATGLFFSWKGKLYQSNSLIKSLKNPSKFDLHKWHFKARCKDLTFIGKISSEPKKMILYRFEDPDGSYRFSHNNFFADLQVDIIDNNTSEKIAVMTSNNSSYEFTGSKQSSLVTQKVGF